MSNLKYRESIDIPKDILFPELNHPLSIFQILYNKTLKKDTKNNNLDKNKNKTEEFLKIIEDLRLKEEMIETDKDYLIKESRKEMRINQEMLFLLGKKGGEFKKAKNLGKIKLDKKIFINPLEKNEKKFLIAKCKSNVNILKLPIINNIKKKNKKLKISNSVIKNSINYRPSQHKIFLSERNSPKIRFNDSVSNTNEDDDSSKKMNDNISSYNSSKNINNKKNLKKSLNTILIQSASRNRNKDNLFSSKTINIFSSNYNGCSDMDILNDFAINRTNKKPVISLLDNINEELKSDEKRHKNYFRNNDYGCELSKFKINYLERHFFQ